MRCRGCLAPQGIVIEAGASDLHCAAAAQRQTVDPEIRRNRRPRRFALRCVRAANRREPTPSDAQAAQCTSLDLILSKSHSGPPHCKSQAGASGAKPGAGGSRSDVHTEQGSAVTSANSNGSRGVRDSATADAYAVPLNLNRVDPRLAAPMLPDLGLLELDVTCQSESAPPAAESPTGTSAQAVDAATEQQRALKPSRVELPSRVSEFSWLRAVH
jgi:hypothetical protein